MLKRISISDFVIFTTLAVDFTEGLTVLTGETGAGKSILLDAMGLVLGDAADREAIRQGAEESAIEAVFAPPQNHPVWQFLSKQDGMKISGGELRIRRVTGQGDKDDITVNGAPVALPFLKELGAYLIEIHGQNANQTFLAPENQMFLLDAFGAYPPEIRGNVAAAWQRIQQITRELEEERVFFLRAEREKPVLERIAAACEKIGMKKGLYKELKDSHASLVSTRDISDLFHSINAQLVAQTGVELTLLRVNRMLETQKDPAVDLMKRHLKDALDRTADAIAQMRELSPKYLDIDTSGIGKLEERMDALKSVAAERKVSPEDFSETDYDVMIARLKRIREAPAKMKEFDVQLTKANELYHQYASILSEERKKAAKKLSAAITGEMPPLKMPNAQVEVEVVEHPNECSIHGFNTIVFTARMNPGMPFSPIAKTASGGELARLVLAIKMILQQVQIASTLVFDEIDLGIGGAAAAAVGGRIARLAETAQILVVTHSPQVASRGTQHLHASKKTDGATTRTVLEVLSLESRINEVSRMLAGEEITGESLAAARTLIEEARSAAEARRNAGAAAV